MLAIFSKRNHQSLLFRAGILLVMIAAGFSIPLPATAQEPEPGTEIEVFSVVQQDLDQDGNPDLTIIECAFITDHDRVLVYDRGRDMKSSQDWWQATDFENDLWVFDAAADGQVELIIEFRRRGEDLLASLWDDQDGDGTVRYQPPPNLEIQESLTPTLKVFALGGWWSRNGKINFNLDLTVDGQIQASFTAKTWLKYIRTDGAPDFLIKIRDTNGDGRPDIQWVNAWPKAPNDIGVRRTEISVNPSDDEPPIKGSIFWPFLGSTRDWDQLRSDRPARIPADRINIRQERSGYNKYYGISMPPIQMLWDKGSLLYVGEFVASRFNDENWFIYSIRRVNANRTSPVNFEAPFAFYDLGDDNDGYPELAIRFEHYLERDMFPFRRKNPEPVQVIRYSWDQDNDTTWDYKLGLIGRHPVNDTVVIDDLTLQLIPPSLLPGWIINNSWDGATFVASEGSKFWTSEGIYEWDPSENWRDNYVTGLSDIQPVENDLGDLNVGMRGEYVFDLHRQPGLYLSSVDHKLHLLNAQGGRWKVDQTHEIQYVNLGGDYINQWTLFKNGVPQKSLYFMPGYLIFADSSGVQFNSSDQPPALFNIAPPTSNEERLELERKLALYRIEVNPLDFESLFAQAGRPTVRIEAANLRDLRPLNNGFRFVLELQPGFSISGLPDMNSESFAPGAYLITYDGKFDIQPLTPPDLSISMRMPALESRVAGIPTSIQTQIANNGLEDAQNLSLVITARQDETSSDLAQQAVTLLSEVPVQVALNWTPPSPGKWDFRATLTDPESGAIITDVSQSIEVARSKADPPGILLLSAGGYSEILALALTLLILLAIVGFVLRIALRTGDQSGIEQD